MNKAEKEAAIQECITRINSSRNKDGARNTNDSEEECDRLLLLLLNEIFYIDKELIDDHHIENLFNLYLKYDHSKLMGFIQQRAKLPENSDTKCGEHGLYVEQAYILLWNGEKDEALQILLQGASTSNI